MTLHTLLIFYECLKQMLDKIFIIISIAIFATTVINMWGIGKVLDELEHLRNDIKEMRKEYNKV